MTSINSLFGELEQDSAIVFEADAKPDVRPDVRGPQFSTEARTSSAGSAYAREHDVRAGPPTVEAWGRCRQSKQPDEDEGALEPTSSRMSRASASDDIQMTHIDGFHTVALEISIPRTFHFSPRRWLGAPVRTPPRCPVALSLDPM